MKFFPASLLLSTLLPAVSYAAPQSSSSISPRAGGIYADVFAGATIDSGKAFTFIQGTFTVPSVTQGLNPNHYTTDAWSIDVSVQLWGTVLYDSDPDWYVYEGPMLFAQVDQYNDTLYQIYTFGALREISVAPGDVIRMTVNAAVLSMTCMVENLSTGESVSDALAGPAIAEPGYHQQARWAVSIGDEDLAAFDQVVFTDCVAGNLTSNITLADATILDYSLDGAQHMTTSVESNQITVQFEN